MYNFKQQVLEDTVAEMQKKFKADLKPLLVGFLFPWLLSTYKYHEIQDIFTVTILDLPLTSILTVAFLPIFVVSARRRKVIIIYICGWIH